MLPIIYSALETVEVEERRALVRSFIVFVKETSEQLNKYASQPTWTFLLGDWLNSKRAEVQRIERQSRTLKPNVGVATGVDIKEHLLLKDREQELKRIKQVVRPQPQVLLHARPCCRVPLLPFIAAFVHAK